MKNIEQFAKGLGNKFLNYFEPYVKKQNRKGKIWVDEDTNSIIMNRFKKRPKNSHQPTDQEITAIIKQVKDELK